MRNLDWRRARRLRTMPVLLASIVTALIALFGFRADAADCVSPIISCGCTITSPEVFETSGPLATLSTTTDCIGIQAAGAVLVLAGDITGPGAGATNVGIHILNGATNAFVEASNTVAFSPHTVSGFATGVQDDASGAVIDGIFANGNLKSGIFINGASNSEINDCHANMNSGVPGMLIAGGSDNVVSDGEADSNGVGIEISGGASHTHVFDSKASDNTVYGIQISGSNSNHIKDSGGGGGAGGTGLYIGCAASGGPTGMACAPVVPPANLNVVEESGGSQSNIGMAIDLGDSMNTLFFNGTSDDTTADLVDENHKCDHNLWFNNGHKLKPLQSCVQ